MNCHLCGDRGLVRVCYHEDKQPERTYDVGVCLCAAGRRLRVDRNREHVVIPRSQLWAHEHGVEIERIWPIEDLLDAEEITRHFPDGPTWSSLSAIDRAAQGRPRVRL